MKNNRVLIVANDFTTVYNFRIELVEFLIKQGMEVVIALPEDERNQKLKDAGCRVCHLKMSRFGTNPFTDLKTMISIIGIIKQIKPDIMLTYTAKPNIYGGLAGSFTKTPYIANVTGLGANFEKKNFISKIMLMLQKVAYKKAKMVFFQNKSNMDFFVKEKIVKKNYDLLPGSGVNVDSNPYEEYPHNEIMKFITVARIRRDKGYDELFDVINKLHEQGVSAEFHIVGWYEDDEYKEVVESIQDQSVIFYDGVSHERVHELIQQCDCLIHPSHHEGMSNVILEAAAAGRPAIVSNIAGCAEGVDDTKTGYYFEVKNAEDLYQKVCLMMQTDNETRCNMGKAAREKICKQFDRKIIIEKYFSLIKQ